MIADKYYDIDAGSNLVFTTTQFTASPSDTEVWSFVVTQSDYSPLPAGITYTTSGAAGLQFTVDPTLAPGTYEIKAEAYLNTGESNGDLIFTVTSVGIDTPFVAPPSIYTWVHDPIVTVFIEPYVLTPADYVDTWTYTFSVAPVASIFSTWSPTPIITMTQLNTDNTSPVM